MSSFWRNIIKLPTLGRAWVSSMVLRKNKPVFAEWNITFRCPFRCKYCGASEVSSVRELGTEEVKTVLEGIYRAGVRWITFGGGEPLVRSDIGEILVYAKKLGFSVYLSTTGVFLEKMDNVEKYVDHINLSFDGPEKVHDEIRGEGSYKKLMSVVEFCREKKISVSFLCVISKCNLESIDFVIAKAKELKIPVMFQPATLHLDSSNLPNPIAPPVTEYRKVMERIIEAKKKGEWIRNSLSGLKYLANWPEPAPIWCPAGRLTITIEPDGTIFSCHLYEFPKVQGTKSICAETNDLRDVFRELVIPTSCNRCWCAPLVELSLLWNLDISALMNVFWL